MRLLNRRPGPAARVLLPALPFLLVVATYLLFSAQRLAANADDKLLPGPAKLWAAFERMALMADLRTGHYLLWWDMAASLQRLLTGLAQAQALIRRPKVLLLDEPFGALDPGIRADIHGLMAQLWRECGTTVVMVTHDLSEAFRLATRVVALERPQPSAGSRVTHDIEVWPRKVVA